LLEKNETKLSEMQLPSHIGSGFLGGRVLRANNNLLLYITIIIIHIGADFHIGA